MTFVNPIDKDKTADHPGLIAYPHSIGSMLVKPEDVGKLKSRALAAMEEQTQRQLLQLQLQAELLAEQANSIKRRMEISYKIYEAKLSFEAFVGGTYHLYEQNGEHKLMMIGPSEWGRNKSPSLNFVNSVRLLADHTWEIVE